MSLDYYIYLRGDAAVSKDTIEQYARSHGVHIKLHPSFQPFWNIGFTPIAFTSERFSQDGQQEFISGFELYSSEYQHIIPLPKSKTGLLRNLFKAKPVQESPFDRAIKDARWLIELRCSGTDPFAVLFAYMLGACFAEDGCGVFDDPQTGQFYDNERHLGHEIAEMLDDLQRQYNAGKLCMHAFKGWP